MITSATNPGGDAEYHVPAWDTAFIIQLMSCIESIPR